MRKGDKIAGKYRVERVLGKGAMGVVVAATHLKLERRVAIKLMSGDLFGRPEMVARFGREARAVAKLKSEHVARVLDVGELEGGVPYIVMEYLEGEDLGALLARRGPLPSAEAAGYVLEACEALAEAHACGIVHRDLKPENLFLATRPGGAPLVKVIDFGVSKGPSEATDRGLGLTTAAAVMGSPLYMAPEQLRSARDADPRSDVWSLGVILYELLSGRTPFQGADLTELVTSVMTSRPPPLGRPDLPPGLEWLVERCLRRERNERYGDVAALATGLAQFATAEGRASAERVVRVLHGSMRPTRASPALATTVALSSPDDSPTSRSIVALPGAAKGGEAGRSGRAMTLLLSAVVMASTLVIGAGVYSLRKAPPRPAGAPPSPSAAGPAIETFVDGPAAGASAAPSPPLSGPQASAAQSSAPSPEVPSPEAASPGANLRAGAAPSGRQPPRPSALPSTPPRPAQTQAPASHAQAQAPSSPLPQAPAPPPKNPFDMPIKLPVHVDEKRPRPPRRPTARRPAPFRHARRGPRRGAAARRVGRPPAAAPAEAPARGERPPRAFAPAARRAAAL